MPKSAVRRLRKASQKFRIENPKLYARRASECKLIARVIKSENNREW